MSNFYTSETSELIEISPTLRVRIVADSDPMSPTDWDNLGEIAYNSRYCLGTEEVSQDRMDEIASGIRKGELVGLPVYAYVHSGATINTRPFSCPWDSGMSGFVYCSVEQARAEFNGRNFKAKARKCLEQEVKTFDQYLTGDVWGFIVEVRVNEDEDEDAEWENIDSCWGFYGLEYAIEEGTSAGKYQLEQLLIEAAAQKEAEIKEAAERKACEERDIMTVTW